MWLTHMDALEAVLMLFVISPGRSPYCGHSHYFFIFQDHFLSGKNSMPLSHVIGSPLPDPVVMANADYRHMTHLIHQQTNFSILYQEYFS
jgi:hypothetical protein